MYCGISKSREFYILSYTFLVFLFFCFAQLFLGDRLVWSVGFVFHVEVDCIYPFEVICRVFPWVRVVRAVLSPR